MDPKAELMNLEARVAALEAQVAGLKRDLAGLAYAQGTTLRVGEPEPKPQLGEGVP